MESKTLARGIHALTAGSTTNPTAILLAGWPQTSAAWTEIIPQLAQSYHVLALDLPGLVSAPAPTYDTETISGILSEAVREYAPYHLVGHDVGGWIAYTWAAKYPDQLKSVTLLDTAIPGLMPDMTFPLPSAVNVKRWQFSFNALPEIPEILVQGRERQLLDYQFKMKCAHPERISEERRDQYAQAYAKPGALTAGFEYYRATETNAVQNKQLAKEKLNMPVFVLGGETGVADSLEKVMRGLANDVSGQVVNDCGHFMMEEQPGIVGQAILAFLDKPQ